jgi:hypothetical protein
MRPLAIAWHGLWFTQAGLYPALLALLLRRRLHKEFPLFCLFIGYSSLHVTGQLVMNYAPRVSGDEYYAVDAASTAVLAALSLAVVHELFRHALNDCAVFGDLGAKPFRWGTILLIAVAIALAWTTPASGAGHVMSVFYLLKRTMNVLLCGLLMLLFVSLRYLRLSWKSYSFGIALGLGIVTSANLGAYAVRSQIEPIARNVSTDILDVISEGAALCSVVVWMVYLALPQRKPNAIVKPVPEHDLETWNQELERLLHQ